MTDKPARPGKPLPTPTVKAGAQRSTRPSANSQNSLRQADTRWQRTVRYGWDKGGSKGGR